VKRAKPCDQDDDVDDSPSCDDDVESQEEKKRAAVKLKTSADTINDRGETLLEAAARKKLKKAKKERRARCRYTSS
jgi:hypothetical protein